MRNRSALVVLAGLLLVGCRGGSDGGEVLEGENVEVQMFDNRFEYTEIRIPAGGSVNWLGAGANPHNSVDAQDQWSTEDVWGDLEQLDGDAATVTYDRPGEYTFFCTFHGNRDGAGMAGKLIVEDR